MIKKLFFAAALLMPGVAHAGNPSANLSVQIVPPSAGAIACDQGPNIASIPAPAQKAGFTHCALNADFTSSSYANTANWLYECGAKSDNALHATFYLYFNSNYSPSSGLPKPNPLVKEAPCSRAMMVSDSGLPQVLRLEYDPTDGTVNGYDYLAMIWPGTSWGTEFGSMIGGQPGGGPQSAGMPMTVYVEWEERRTLPNTNHNMLYGGFWQDQCHGCTSSPFQEVDFGEIDVQPSFAALLPGAPGAAGGGTVYYDPTIYHRFGALVTTDGSNNAGYCLYMDSGIDTTTPSNCISFTTPNSGGTTTFYRELNNWLGGESCFGSPGCFTNTVYSWTQYIRVWGCSSFWTSACTSSIITSENARKIKDPSEFAQLIHSLPVAVRQ